MGNRHSGVPVCKPRKNVHWKTAGRPAAPGKPEVVLIDPEGSEGSVRLRWDPPAHDGGATLVGYEVECRREGVTAWLRTTPPLVTKPELILSGLEPPYCYTFRVTAVNVVGGGERGPVSDVLALRPAIKRAPTFLQRLRDTTALENEKTEFRVTFDGSPHPVVAWFKDGYEIFSSRRTAITTSDTQSVLIIHQTLTSDEGEIKCTITNRLGHAVTVARLSLEAAPKLRYPRQYEDGLLYEINETVYLKTSVVGKPTPVLEWRHNGLPILVDDRVQIATSSKFSILKIQNARRTDRGEYQIVATNAIGTDTAAFLLTITAPPESPTHVSVARQVDKSVTLSWEPPADDGGCRVGNYVVEYYRAGWDVWLKATTSRKTTVTLFDLIEGSEYRFRVKAESPYGMSAPSVESSSVRIPGRAVEMQFLAVESKIISTALLREDGDEVRQERVRDTNSSEPVETNARIDQVKEKRKSFQLDLSESLSPPPLSLSAPELSARCVMPFKSLRNSVSSSELLLEHAMARFYQAVAMEEEHQRRHIPSRVEFPPAADDAVQHAVEHTAPKIVIKSDSVESKERDSTQSSMEDCANRWNMSFEEDYTASTVSTDESEASVHDDTRQVPIQEEQTYSPRDKPLLSSPFYNEPEEANKPITLPNPNFVPKPILKRREPEIIEVIPEQKTKKQEKSIFKKFTKMPVQRPFSFPKLLQRKEEDKIPEECSPPAHSPSTEPPPRAEKEDEGMTVIDYYGSIVKEFGSNKKPQTTLYLKTEELKHVAEQQEEQPPTQHITRATETSNGKTKHANVNAKANNKTKAVKCISKQPQKKRPTAPKEMKPNAVKREKSPVKQNIDQDKCRQRVVLTTERATVVIPIDYAELEQQAAVTVRSAIDYVVDCCLLLLAFWLFLFEDERLAIPLLVLIIYRQLNTAVRRLPRWIAAHTPRAIRPAWLT